MNGARNFGGEGFVGLASTGVGGVFGFERFDFGAGEERELAEVFADLGILGVYEELVELVGARFFRIEPDGATLGFAELCAVGFGDERKGESPGGESRFFADEIGAGRDVAPLLGATDLEFAV